MHGGLGRSNIVGRPVSSCQVIICPWENRTVSMSLPKTKNLKDICRSAEITVAALGKPEFVTADMVKEGAVVIDVGISRVPDEKQRN